MKKAILNKVRLTAAILVFALLAKFALAATFDWYPSDPSATYTFAENETFYMDLNVTVNETNIKYSDNSEFIFLPFSIDNQTGAINFTVTNDNVGLSDPITIIAENITNEFDKIIATFRFNVTNVNDPPNITSYSPSSLTAFVSENSTLVFSYDNLTADIDLIHSGEDSLIQNWTLDNATQTTNYTWYFTPGYCDAGEYALMLNITDSYNLSDFISWNITVNNTNRLPENNASLPNVSLAEDANSTFVFDLDEYFSDADFNECNGSQKDTITYAAINNTNITVTIDPATHRVNMTPDPNYFGVEYIYFSADDSYNTSYSNVIIVQVNDTNDAPNVTALGNKTGYEGALFELQVSANDPDMDVLTYYDNTDLFDINSANGLISFVPNTTQAGSYTINITVSDSELNTTVELNLTIIDNNPPELNLIGNQNATENIPFVLNISANESDSQNITWWSNSTIFNITSINETHGQISFTPTNDDVGNYSINITVFDEYNATDFEVIDFQVIDVLNAPVLSPIGSQSPRVNITFTLYIDASDLDGDNLTFYNNQSPDLFNMTIINSSRVMINFTPTDSDVGNYSILFNVTDGGLWDSEIVSFEVRYNLIPHIDNIADQLVIENSQFQINVSGYDGDMDPLTFYTNYSGFTVVPYNNSLSTLIITPDQQDVGDHNVTVNVTDGWGAWNMTYFNFSVQEFNDTPYFNPGFNSNYTAFADTQFLQYFEYVEEENDTVAVSDNTSLFNISLVNSTHALINFTPNSSQINDYSVEINITDFNSTNTSIVLFMVKPFNYAPNITSFSPLTNASVAENSSLNFTHVSSDPNGDTLTYFWLINGIEVATTMNYTYSPGFDDAGLKNVTLIVTDGFLNDTQEWNITVNNTNRLTIFGTKGLYNYSDFSPGSLTRINLTDEGVIQLAGNGSDYYTNGTYISPVIDLLDTNYHNISRAKWVSSSPASTFISVHARTSASNVSGWSAWGERINSSNTSVNAPDNRYIQFLINLTTNDTSLTPNFTDLEVFYLIGNKTLADNSDEFWIDLDNYFLDPDGSDNLTYNHSGSSIIVITINNLTHQVRLQPQSSGEDDVYFYAYDGENITSSNLVHFTVTESGSQQQEQTSGGGGGSSRDREVIIKETEIVNRTQNVTVPLAFELLVPGLVTVYQNETFTVPITLSNYESNMTLQDIYLSASSDNPDIDINFKQFFFDELRPNETIETELYITSYRVFGSYEVVVRANVNEPEYNDTSKFFINSLEKGAENRTQINTKLSFAQDLLSSNPECLELGEILVEARNAIEKKDYKLAQDLLTTVIDGCKYLINLNESFVPEYEEPWADRGYNWISGLWNRITQSNLALSAFIILVFLGALSTALYYVHRKRLSDKEQEMVDESSELDKAKEES